MNKETAAGRRRIHASKTKKVPVPQPASTARALRRRIRLPTIEQIRSGFTTERLNELGQLEVSDDQLSSVVRVPRATLNRRRKSGQLTQEEGDRTAIVMRVFAKAVDYFEGDEDAARRRMKHPARAFGGETPLKRCDTSPGAQEVITLLSQLEYGIPS
jgi:putative toxin-antitoxin system antitoxin component (TIGR02293 family)